MEFNIEPSLQQRNVTFSVEIKFFDSVCNSYPTLSSEIEMGISRVVTRRNSIAPLPKLWTFLPDADEFQ